MFAIAQATKCRLNEGNLHLTASRENYSQYTFQILAENPDRFMIFSPQLIVMFEQKFGGTLPDFKMINSDKRNK
jgi:hypothetical protein